MGRDKAALPHPAGGTLLSRQLTLLDPLAPAEKLLSLRHDQTAPAEVTPSWRVVRDTGEHGPLGGIVAALAASTAPRLLVLAVDLPGMDLATLCALLDAPTTGGVVPRGACGFEPLAALYPRTWLPRAHAAVAAGQLGLQGLLAAGVATGEFRVIPAVPGPAWAHWNRPDDLPPGLPPA
jgi:molybdenum cofactor guanylyltransferase